MPFHYALDQRPRFDGGREEVLGFFQAERFRHLDGEVQKDAANLLVFEQTEQKKW